MIDKFPPTIGTWRATYRRREAMVLSGPRQKFLFSFAGAALFSLFIWNTARRQLLQRELCGIWIFPALCGKR